MSNEAHLKYEGLTAAQVEESREKHGENLLTPPAKTPLWKLYLEKYQDPVIKVLLFAVVLSFLIACFEGDFAETIGIILAVFLATTVGFYFEYDAARKFDLLNAGKEETPVRVIRDGKVQEVARKEIVVGDVVLLEGGEEIPADGTLLEAISLQVNESSLTGELMVEKTTVEALFDEEATYPSNRVLRGTTVTNGHGVMRVELVGDATEIGKVARLATEEPEEETPLNRQLTHLASLIGKVGFSVAGLTFVVLLAKACYHAFTDEPLTDTDSYLLFFQQILHYFMVAVTLVVVTVPEGLPMSITLSLALNMRRMLSTNNLVRKMHASETMGAVTVICTDKTGTLTQNQMTVQEANFELMGKGALPALLAEGISLNTTAYVETTNEGVTGMGNPTEIACLKWLQAQGEDFLTWRNKAETLVQLPFSTEYKVMMTVVRSAVDNRLRIYLKGAPEAVMRRCSERYTAEGATAPLEGVQPAIEAALAGYQQKALRTLAFAVKEISEEEVQAWKLEKDASSEGTKTAEKAKTAVEATVRKEGNHNHRRPFDPKDLLTLSDFQWMGMVAIADPIRPEVPEAVARCQQAGIEIKMVTGDTPGTAKEIGRQIGLWKPETPDTACITGTEFAALGDDEAAQRAKEIHIMARARPTDKQRLVTLLQQQGEVVAVTGDGTNDAPALNFAQVGLSMGSGTSVAKEASDITLLDDSFRSIGTAVMWGRSLYKNIQRFIAFQLTINVVAMFIVLAGSISGFDSPLTVTQMLWVNLIMDTFAALVLASIPPNDEVMQEQPRSSEAFIITPSMMRTILGWGIAFIVALGALYGYFMVNGGITPYALTIFFTVFVLMQFWNLFNARVWGSQRSAFSGFKHTYTLPAVALVILVGQFLIVQWGGALFRTVPLPMQTWLWLLLLTSPVLWIGELIRWFQHPKKRKE
jgi:Ca2+-transporting ATPase